ncbi:hypothetical protein GIB67_004756 [Kingdonia uniflora]|uniref:RNase H type-1 domain-containing protein n=1 Tax=Kingdonia uniflora TaxID=39325 RepID=A0A7J7NQK5_9MAGN|nr:hypothetical protein GIB67_004756 [Kingdonia uniflora]
MPYYEGRLGIKDIVTMNKAAMLRFVWRIVSKEELLWINSAKANLIRNKDFRLMKIPTDSSWRWRNIRKGREDAKGLILHTIGDGKDTKFRADPWHPTGCLHCENLYMKLLEAVTVKMRLRGLFLRGEYSLKSAYEQFRDLEEAPSWSNMFEHCGSLKDVGEIGAILRREDGTAIKACAGAVMKQSITLLKLHGIDHGQKLALELGIKRITVGSDSITAVNIVKLLTDHPGKLELLLAPFFSPSDS